MVEYCCSSDWHNCNDNTTHTDKAYASMAACVIAELHVFLEDWFAGRCPNSDEEWQRRLLDRFTADFHIAMLGNKSPSVV